MRFAGQRFRAGSGYTSEYRAPRGQADSGRSVMQIPLALVQ